MQTKINSAVTPSTVQIVASRGITPAAPLTDPFIPVRQDATNPERWSEWRINQNLTDRWGDLNYYAQASKPLALLENDPELLNRLRAQMWDEITFVVRKDGAFGILFEVEYGSKESEALLAKEDPKYLETLKPHAEKVQILLDGIARLAPDYPGVQFAVPDEGQIVEERPAVWAFMPDGLLDAEQRKALGYALLAL